MGVGRALVSGDGEAVCLGDARVEAAPHQSLELCIEGSRGQRLEGRKES